MIWLLSLICGITASILTYFSDKENILKIVVVFFFAQVGLILFCFLMITIPALFVNKNKPIKKPSKYFNFLYTYICQFVCQIARVKVKVSNKELFTSDTNYLIICNHKSNFDPFIITETFRKHRIGFASKIANFNLPIGGQIVHKCGFVPIDKNDNREALKSIILASNFIKDDRTFDYAIFPEGKRNFENNEVLEFKNGCLKIAQKAQTPVLVMTIHNTEKIKKNFPLKSTKVYIDILEVIPAERFENESCTEIGNYARELMLKNVTEFNYKQK